MEITDFFIPSNREFLVEEQRVEDLGERIEQFFYQKLKDHPDFKEEDLSDVIFGSIEIYNQDEKIELGLNDENFNSAILETCFYISIMSLLNFLDEKGRSELKELIKGITQTELEVYRDFSE